MVATGHDAEAPSTKEEIPHDHLFKVTGLSSSNLEKLAEAQEAADFETAIAATGYGRFNVVLMLCSLPAFWSAVSVTSSVSYIFTRAQCDMQLSLLDMGTISGITYGGMISSAMVWGFLSDTLGRKRIMALGFLGSGLVEVAAAMSQSFLMLLLTRFASGFLFNGPFAVLLSYMAEVHRTELRARVILLTSLFYTIANTTIPLLAWAILTKDWHFHIYGNDFVVHSWNLFLLATALVPLLTGLAFLCLPESPKFLMSRGRNEEALKIFRKIYSMNTRKPEEDYPITLLVEEKSEEQGRGFAALRGGVVQLAPLFRPPHLKWLVLICVIHMGCMFGSNTIRLWYPQLAAMIGSNNGSLCAAIAPASAPPLTDCAPLHTDMMTYLQSAVVGAGSVLTYSIGGAMINKCGKKVVVGSCGVSSAVLMLLLPLLGTDAFAVAAMVTALLAFTSLYSAALSSVTVDLFPTSLRALPKLSSIRGFGRLEWLRATCSCLMLLLLAFTSLYSAALSSVTVDLFPASLRVMAMATFLMCGRLGTIAGTVIFPALITFGCWPPFITIAAVLGVCGAACCFLPNTTLKKLE